jgi:hypothetical protein
MSSNGTNKNLGNSKNESAKIFPPTQKKPPKPTVKPPKSKESKS